MLYVLDKRDKNEKKALGLRIKLLREGAGLSTKGLAELTGLTDGGIKMIESGRRWPRPETAEAIASALKVPYNYLYTTSGAEDFRAREIENLEKMKIALEVAIYAPKDVLELLAKLRLGQWRAIKKSAELELKPMAAKKSSKKEG